MFNNISYIDGIKSKLITKTYHQYNPCKRCTPETYDINDPLISNPFLT